MYEQQKNQKVVDDLKDKIAKLELENRQMEILNNDLKKDNDKYREKVQEMDKLLHELQQADDQLAKNC